MLLDVATQYGLDPRWQAATMGGEYASFCPVCGGHDRFRLNPNRQMKKCTGSFYCRKCGVRGDTIKFCMEFLKDTYPQACQRLGIELDGVSAPTVRSLIPKLSQPIFTPAPIVYPPELWVQEANLFVAWAHKNLLHCPIALSYLSKRGLDLDAVKRFKIGLCTETAYINRTLWGMEEGNDLWFPEGLVVPILDGDNAIRLKIRRKQWKPGDDIPKYINISGSATGVSFLGSHLKRNGMVVESELDALMLQYHLGEEIFVIGTGSCTRNPDEYTHEIVSLCRRVYISYDNDEGGTKMWKKWKDLYSHAIQAPVKTGKDLGEAVELGLNVKEWWNKLRK